MKEENYDTLQNHSHDSFGCHWNEVIKTHFIQQDKIEIDAL